MTEARLNLAPLLDIFERDVCAERWRQLKKWGVQKLPDGTGWFYKQDADDHRRRADEAAFNDRLTWRHVLTEEFYEALAEEDEVALRAELVQVATVALAWVEDIDSRTHDRLTEADRLLELQDAAELELVNS